MIMTFSHPNMTCVSEKRAFHESRKLIFLYIKREFRASPGVSVDRHHQFHVDATPIGKATISLLVAYGYLHGFKVRTCVKYVPKQSIA